jgi:hypothetical protein
VDSNPAKFQSSRKSIVGEVVKIFDPVFRRIEAAAASSITFFGPELSMMVCMNGLVVIFFVGERVSVLVCLFVLYVCLIEVLLF